MGEPQAEKTVLGDSDAVSDGHRDFSQHQSVLLWLQDRLAEQGTERFAWLDLGCGKGQILHGIARNFSPEARAKLEYYGVDAVDSHVNETELLALKCRLRSVRVERASLGDLDAFTTARFDLVTCINTCHELDPVSMCSALATAVHMLADRGILYCYDMEQLPVQRSELGAITWTREEMETILNSTLGPLGGESAAILTGRVNHSSCTAWYALIKRDLLGLQNGNPSALSNCIDAGLRSIDELLVTKRQQVSEMLEVLTKCGAQTAAEKDDRTRALYDYWSLNRVRRAE